MVADVALRMDTMYRHQRHFYDVTRKFYLFGRDRLLTQLPVAEGSTVLEIGCGTGRNLVSLARLRPGARLFGIDASRAMLGTAERSMRRAGVAKSVALAAADATRFDGERIFGLQGFDVIYFSYVLSMLPDWRTAVDRALSQLNPGGTLAVVDFGDQAGSPNWRRHLLLRWLALFDVRPRAEIERGLRNLAEEHSGLYVDDDILAGYGYLLMFQRRG